MYLVSIGWYQEIEYHLLIPGHSHWIVDRDCFSPIGRMCFTHNCYSMQHFWDDFIGHAFDNSRLPYALLLPCVLDWKEFLQPCLRDITGHSVPRSFRICLQNRVPVLFYKDCCLDTTWKGFFADYGIQLLHSMPAGVPSVFPPTPVPEDQLPDLDLF